MTSFFNIAKRTLLTPKSLLINKLYSVASKNNFLIYKNITIYEGKRGFLVPLIIVDKNRGIYIFKVESHSYDELKNSKLQDIKKQGFNRLSFEKIQNLIDIKLENIEKKVPIFKFLLMENLNIAQYDYLDSSFHDLLPKDIILFNDTSEADILKKFQTISSPLESVIDISAVIGSLLFQYSIKEDNSHYLVTTEQMKFIDADIEGEVTLKGKIGSGRTSLLLLKAVHDILNESTLTIVIVKSTLLASQRLERQLLNLLKDNRITIDRDSIKILTPRDIVNKHLKKLHKKELGRKLKIDKDLMKKRFYLADKLFCDDVDFIENEFLTYLIHIQKERTVLFVTNNNYKETYSLTKSFRLENQKVSFYICEPYKKALEIVKNILTSSAPQNILIVSNNIIGQELIKHHLEIDLDKEIVDDIQLSIYNDIHGLSAKSVILMDGCVASFRDLAYSFYLAKRDTYVLHDEMCEQINSLRNSYENNKN
ncbi:MAG: hypothetical protein U9P38_09145 [Campylobacterota bacterium]|nr:hypothetical protein [Campylobacterota bacterium]